MWSYGDVLVLRLIDWLRQDKDPGSFPRSPMARIRALLSSVEALGEVLEEGLPVAVDSTGTIVLHLDGIQHIPVGRAALQARMGLDLDLLLPYRDRGPDLRWPRPSLRIIPGKLSGQPHVGETRIETAALAALSARGFTSLDIIELYPVLTLDNVAEAIQLEQQISHVA